MKDANQILCANLTKWQTLPAGESRRHVHDLLHLSDQALMDMYNEFIPFWQKERGWEHERYKNYFTGRHVLEIGSGLGYDALTISKSTATWTCADIISDNIKFVQRLANIFKASNLSAELIEDVFNHDFNRNFDGFYAHGVLHHIPFEQACQQVANISNHLSRGAKIALLMYPKQRWEHCGCPSFEQFGVMTDGEGTPWAEWYDEEKIIALMGSDFELTNTIPWGWNNIEFINFELFKAR